MQLIPHTKAGREFFAAGAAPSRARWCDWIERGVVRGKIIDGRPYIDANWFAASGPVLEAVDTPRASTTALDLLAG